MKFLLTLAAILAGGMVIGHAHANGSDVNQMQSAPKPAPAWLKGMVDQGKFDPRLRGYFTPEGIRVEIVADYPTVVNPVGMTFDDAGTPYVLEWLPGGGDWNESPVTFRYRDGSTRQVATMKKPFPDVVKVLREGSRKGVYDQASIIVHDELPSSILVHDGWIYLSGRGTIRRYRQSRPGGPYDVMQVIAQGFCGFHHHQVSGMTIGNDGWLYITSGDDDNFVEGSDGSRATVLRTGAVFRSRPDGSQMHVYAIGFRNPYRDVAFDSAFNMFHADNDNEDGTKFTGCRLMHVAEGADYGWRLRQGARCCAADTVRGAAFGETPGKMTPLLKTGRGAPAGLLIYNDSQFPQPYRGLLYYPDVFRRLVRAYAVAPKGASFEVTHEFELMKSDDPLFRPNQMVVGPDGAIYVVDWRTDSGGAGRLSGDGRHGRIYRLTWAGSELAPAIPLRPMDTWAKIRELADDALAALLGGEDQTVRDRAKRELVRRGRFDGLRAILADKRKPLAARIAALGGIQSDWNATTQSAVISALSDEQADIRRLAAEALALNAAKSDRAAHDVLVARLGDADPKVKRAAALAVGQIAAPGAEEALARAYFALTEAELSDRYLADGLVRALERLGERGTRRLVESAGSFNASERDKAVAAFVGLRTRAGAEELPRMLEQRGLLPQQRVALLRSYTNYLLEPPVSPLRPVFDFLKRNPREGREVKLGALEVLLVTDSLKGPEADALLLSLLEVNDPAVTQAVLLAIEGARVTSLAPELVRRLPHTTASELRAAMLRTLRALKERSVLTLVPTILATERNEAVRVEAFRTLAELDRASARSLAPLLLDSSSVALQIELIAVLSADVTGASTVGQAFLAKRLPRELLPQVVDALKRHSDNDAAIAQMLTSVMKSGLLISADPAEIARIRELVRTRGNAERGRVVYLNDKLVACTQCHRLETTGGSVGPDLTRVWDTHSVEKLLEDLLEPSKEIKEGYQSYTATTVDGRTHSGLRVSQTATELVLKDATGKIIRIAADDLEQVRPSSTSLMPEGTISRLTFEQFLDLIAFLKSQSAQESLRTRALEMWVVGPFGDDPARGYGPEQNPSERATYDSDKAPGKVGWRLVRTEPDGLLNLRAVFDSDNVSGYAMTYVHSPKEQDATLLVGSDDGVRIWLNNVEVHASLAPRGAAPDTDRVTVRLRAGWNRVLARVMNGALAHGLYLRVEGGEGLTVNPTGGSAQ